MPEGVTAVMCKPDGYRNGSTNNRKYKEGKIYSNTRGRKDRRKGRSEREDERKEQKVGVRERE